MIEMALDSVAEGAEPGQAAWQKVKRLQTINKAANFISLNKLRLWDPFLSFAFVFWKSVPLKALLKLATYPSILAIDGGSFVYNATP